MIQEHLENLSACGKGQTAVLLLLHRTTFFSCFDDSNSTPVMKINPPADDQLQIGLCKELTQARLLAQMASLPEH